MPCVFGKVDLIPVMELQLEDVIGKCALVCERITDEKKYL